MLNWLTSNPEQTNAIAAVVSACVGLLALAVAGLSIFFTIRGLALQREHNRLSVVPVPFIALADYENLIRAKVRNDGIGPLMVKSLTYSRGGTNNEHQDLVSYMPALPEGLFWSNYSSGYVRSIRPGDELILIELAGEIAETKFIEFRNKCRRVLSEMTITVDFTDVYGRTFQPVSRDLDWFGRRLATSHKG